MQVHHWMLQQQLPAFVVLREKKKTSHWIWLALRALKRCLSWHVGYEAPQERFRWGFLPLPWILKRIEFHGECGKQTYRCELAKWEKEKRNCTPWKEFQGSRGIAFRFLNRVFGRLIVLCQVVKIVRRHFLCPYAVFEWQQLYDETLVCVFVNEDFLIIGNVTICAWISS